MNRPSHARMGAAGAALTTAATGRDVVLIAGAAALGAAISHVPDIDHRSRGLWQSYRDWLHCVEPWALVCVVVWQAPGIGSLLALATIGAIGSHMLGDQFTTAGIPVSIVLQLATGRRGRGYGLKLFDSTVRTPGGGYRETLPATLTAWALTVLWAGIALALVLNGGASQ
jgi:membrane-bound metal-dependent hydrolase YbcI (DUF457 family)